MLEYYCRINHENDGKEQPKSGLEAETCQTKMIVSCGKNGKWAQFPESTRTTAAIRTTVEPQLVEMNATTNSHDQIEDSIVIPVRNLYLLRSIPSRIWFQKYIES